MSVVRRQEREQYLRSCARCSGRFKISTMNDSIGFRWVTMSEWRDIYGGKNAADDQKREQSIEPFGSHQRSVATSLFVCIVSTSMAPA